MKTLREVAADLPAKASEKEINKTSHERFSRVRHESVTPPVKGGSWNWPMAEPNRPLSTMASESRALQELFATALSRCGDPSQGHRWALAIGHDEFSHGGMFSVADGRKNMNLSFAFLELGVHNILGDNALFTPVVVRHSWFKLIQGGLGAMFGKHLKLHLLSQTGLATAGATITVFGRNVLIVARTESIIADLDGHRMSLNSNGANGFKPCLRHCNMLKKNSGTAELDPANFVEVSYADPTRFRWQTNADVFAAADLVSAARARWTAGIMTKDRFEKLQMTCGLKFALRGILLDPELRRKVDAVGSAVIDWVHAGLQDGAFTMEAYLLVQAWETAASFQAACATLDMICAAKQGRVGSREGSAQLRRAHAERFRLHEEAHGTENILPKHRMMHRMRRARRGNASNPTAPHGKHGAPRASSICSATLDARQLCSANCTAHRSYL
ncbi:unnamed protein product [Prorocentrum cordatum]|uniref:Uncharacterized protein n=1 Tax=Prorocentrum cordatum TaxID=2364126 RepID=A0ABN9W0G0_9DINO|nr:unnamed protein product [Polarella glacialis]